MVLLVEPSAADNALLPRPLCTHAACTEKLASLEPPWVDLSFQPRIDWRGGGVRGDCVVGEYAYIMNKYCSAQPASAGQLGHWPSEDRLIAADVHSSRLPQSHFGEVSALLPNLTLMVMGDSVMEQFYNTLQCFLRKESYEDPRPSNRTRPEEAVAPRASPLVPAL